MYPVIYTLIMMNIFIPNHGIWNIYHFLFYTVSHLQDIDGVPDNIAIDLKNNYFDSHHNFANEILMLMYPTTTIVQATNCPPEYTELKINTPPDQLQREDPGVYEKAYDYLRNIFLPLLKVYTPQKTYSEYIYITRNGEADKRLVLNETKLLERHVLKKFQVVQLSKITFMDQVYLFNNARFIISCHGAGLTNIVFCDKKCKIIELVTPHMTKLMHFEAIARSLELTYCKFSQVIPKDPNYYSCYSDNFTVDVDALVEYIFNLRSEQHTQA